MEGTSRRSAKTKVIGDVTSVTIPAQYVDFVTKETKPVTPEMLKMVNSALSDRQLVHLIFTGIAAVDSLGNFVSSFEEIQKIFGWKGTLFKDQMDT